MGRTGSPCLGTAATDEPGSFLSTMSINLTLGAQREKCVGSQRKQFFLPLKTPPWDAGEEEPGVLMQQHPALPALRAALSDKRAHRNRHGEHSQRHANGHCLFFFFFSSKIQKHPPHPPAFAAAFRSEQSRGPAAALLSLLCGTALSS